MNNSVIYLLVIAFVQIQIMETILNIPVGKILLVEIKLIICNNA
jgi:hypothetical protein